MVKSALSSEDVLVLLKLAAFETYLWRLNIVSKELGFSTFEVLNSIKRLRENGLLVAHNDYIDLEKFKTFLLYDIQNLFPTTPGPIVQGTLTGANPGAYFAIGLPYDSIWVWPNPDGQDSGFEIKPLSPQCCYAALNDKNLKHLLAITETMRVAGDQAREWAAAELDKVLVPKED